MSQLGKNPEPDEGGSNTDNNRSALLRSCSGGRGCFLDKQFPSENRRFSSFSPLAVAVLCALAFQYFWYC